MKKVLVTGVLGFIFSNFIRSVTHEYPGDKFVGIDKAARPYNLDNMYEAPNYKFYLADITDQHVMDRIFAIEKPDIVINGAAESFVDDSITDIFPFLQANVVGTQVIVNCCLRYNARLLHISTDEIYGQKLSRLDAGWTEDEPLQPRNPYACTKASAELIVRAAHETHGLQFQMSRSCNVFGPRRKKENLIPRILYSLLHKEPVPIHGDGLNFRQYVYVQDKVNALMTILEKGEMNQIYNIGGDSILSNLSVVGHISGFLYSNYPIIKKIEDRKAHDFGYKVNSDKLRNLGWKPETTMIDGLKNTAKWYEEKYGNV